MTCAYYIITTVRFLIRIKGTCIFNSMYGQIKMLRLPIDILRNLKVFEYRMMAFTYLNHFLTQVHYQNMFRLLNHSTHEK